MRLSVTEFNKNLSKYLQQSQNEDIIITSHGKDIALLTSVANQKPKRTLGDFLSEQENLGFDWDLEPDNWEMRDPFAS
jgi:prevent-host-death family protein